MEAIVHLKPLELVDRRQSSRAVHSYLRAFILNGSFPPGTILSQLELSKALGVSRTPLREAFRMLQEEGLIEAEPNLRARVSNCSMDDLAMVYASRIVLESLGVALTAATFSQELKIAAEAALEQMHEAYEQNNLSEWLKAHRNFHNILNSQTSQDISRIVLTLIEKGERYLYIYRLNNSYPWQEHTNETEHRQLLQACIQHRSDEAARLVAHHLGAFASAILAELEPEHPSTAITAALKLVSNHAGENAAGLLYSLSSPKHLQQPIKEIS